MISTMIGDMASTLAVLPVVRLVTPPASMSSFAREISGAIAEASIPQQDVNTSVKVLLGVLNWVTLWFRSRRGQSAAELQELASGTVTFAMRGLGALQ